MAFAEVDGIFRAYAQRLRLPGMACVIVDGRLVHTGTFGVRDVPDRRR